MEWNLEETDRLYALYQEHYDRLRREVVAANRSLGSSSPERTGLLRLTPAQFAAVLTDSSLDQEALLLWIRRIIHGHEQEFQMLQAAG